MPCVIILAFAVLIQGLSLCLELAKLEPSKPQRFSHPYLAPRSSRSLWPLLDFLVDARDIETQVLMFAQPMLLVIELSSLSSKSSGFVFS